MRLFGIVDTLSFVFERVKSLLFATLQVCSHITATVVLLCAYFLNSCIKFSKIYTLNFFDYSSNVQNNIVIKVITEKLIPR